MEYIAIIADRKKISILNEWIRNNGEALSNFKIISGSTSDEVFINTLTRRFFKEDIKMLIYFLDPVRADSMMTVREAVAANIIIALNPETADFILSSKKMEL